MIPILFEMLIRFAISILVELEAQIQINEGKYYE